MSSVRQIERLAVYGEPNKRKETRKRIGRVANVLFHPDGCRVVGFLVERPDMALVMERKDLTLALDRVEILEDRLLVEGDKAWGTAAAKRLGIDWEETVAWVGMPARTESGSPLGEVRDALFDESDGSVEAVGLTGGVTADVALGVRDLPAHLVRGFADGAVIVSDEAAVIGTDGGAAAAAGRGAAVAKVTAERGAVVAVKTAAVAAAYTKKAAKAAAKSETAKKTLGFLKRVRDRIEAAGDPDEK